MLQNLHTFVEVNDIFVHVGQILCCPVAWILDLRSISRLLQACPPLWAVWLSLFYFHLMQTKVMDPQKSFCGPLGVNGPPVMEPLSWPSL